MEMNAAVSTETAAVQTEPVQWAAEEEEDVPVRGGKGSGERICTWAEYRPVWVLLYLTGWIPVGRRNCGACTGIVDVCAREAFALLNVPTPNPVLWDDCKHHAHTQH